MIKKIDLKNRNNLFYKSRLAYYINIVNSK